MYFHRLKKIRKDMNLTQTDVAKVLEITQLSYSKYERGIQTIPIEYILKLADLYKSSPYYILGLTDDPTPLPKA